MEAKARSIIETMARRTDELGKWAVAWLARNIEDIPVHWESVERRLLSENLAEVLSTAEDLLSAARRPATLVPALRRCLAGSPVHALRAALILYGIEEPISDAVPKLLECLSIHDEIQINETFWVIKRRRPNVIHVGTDIVISRVQESEEQDDEDTQDAVGEPPPPPSGRDQFRPTFGFLCAHAVCGAMAWLRKSRHILDENPQSISLVGPLREPLLAALRAGLDGDDFASRCYAIDHLDVLSCFDDSVLAAAILCLHEEFGEWPSRSFWGHLLSESDGKSAALEDRLDVARVLIGRGLKTEPIKMLTRFVAQPTENLSFDYRWMKALKLLVECGTEQALVRQVLVRHLERTRFPFHHLRELLPLLPQVNGSDILLRSLILEQFVQGDTLSTYLIRQWAHREFVYCEDDVQESNNVEGDRRLGCQIPMGGTALDVRTAQIQWLAAQNVPPERIRPAMVLLAVRYDAERATRLTQAIIDRRADTTARELVETALASEETDREGQKFAKAWLLAALTDAVQGV